jgi:hypothetical protein
MGGVTDTIPEWTKSRRGELLDSKGGTATFWHLTEESKRQQETNLES